jgi:ATP-dependent Clp protease protease subunit
MKRLIHIGSVNTQVAQRVCHQLEDFALESDEDIYLFIDSYGGCVASMLAIVAMINRIPNDVVTVVSGKAMSAGAFIAAHGTPGKRLAFPNAQYMFHEPNGFAELTEKGIENMVWVKEYTTKLMAAVSGQSISEMEQMIDRDYYVFAHDLMDHRGSFLDAMIGH